MWGRATSFIRGVVSNQVRRGSSFLTTILLLLQWFTIPAAFAATYSGGSGIEGNPYLISTPADLLTLSNPANNADWDKHFLMTNDIDMSGVTEFMPIGGESAPAFTGVFDGAGHIVQNLTINLPTQNYVGFFGRISGTTCQVRNLTCQGGSVTGGTNYIGGLVGHNQGGTITDCATSSSIAGAWYVGGITGWNDGAVLDSRATGSITGHGYAAGLVGINVASIVGCFATGSVGGNSPMVVGGLVGDNVGTVTACYATGAVTGRESVAGLVGSNGTGGTITACYSTGAVTLAANGTSPGGLVGSGRGVVYISFWDLQTSGQSGSQGGKDLTTTQMKTVSSFKNAGWADYDWTMVNGSYPRLTWEDTGAVAIPTADPVPLTGIGTEADPYRIGTPSEFASLSSYAAVLNKHIVLTSDLDCTGVSLSPIGALGPFSGVFDGVGHTITGVSIQQPDNNMAGIFTMIAEGCEIKNLNVVGGAVTGRDFVGGLVGINLGGTVTACDIALIVTGSGNAVGGLAGETTSGTVEDCSFDGSVTGPNWDVGGLVGYNETATVSGSHATGTISGKGRCGGLIGTNLGSVINCYSSASVTGTSEVGGLIGNNYHDGQTRGCYASGEVTSDNSAGGLVGTNLGAITACYATGSVAGRESIAGFAGTSGYNAIITACYATGATSGITFTGGLVGNFYLADNYIDGAVIASMWDIDTTGQSGSSAGKGLSTAQMKSLVVVRNAGWAAYPEWTMAEGEYPRLAWEMVEGSAVPAPQPLPFSGNGTSDDPYQIESEEQFALLSWLVSVRDKHIVLTRDLNCAGVTLFPVGDLFPFVGVFDGGGHTIYGADIIHPAATLVGVFARLGAGAEIRNLTVDGGHISGKDYVGGLVGWNLDGTVADCNAAHAVTGSEWYVGGLIGKNNGTVSSCDARGVVNGKGAVGGLVGYNNNGSISRCASMAAVSGTSDVGGLVGLNGLSGYATSGSVEQCSASGEVRGNYSIGGLIGTNADTVSESYATGEVTGIGQLGGLIGINNGYSDGCTVTNAYSTGPVVGTGDSIGGLIGLSASGATVSTCYATGTVMGATGLGGLVGANSGSTVSASYWDLTIGGPDNGIGTGLPTSQMRQRATFEPVGWNFAGSPPIWYIFEGQSYPQLFGVAVPIDSIVALQALSTTQYGSFYLTRDIDASETAEWGAKTSDPGFVPIGSAAQPFNGTFDGRGHRISGLHIYRPSQDDIGLFGYLGPSAVVRGIGLEDVEVTGRHQTGGLAGKNLGTVEQCYVQGAVAGGTRVGGLVGENSGAISESYAAASLAGDSVGGLVGTDTGGNVTVSFWDTIVSGTTYSANGFGLETSAMQAQNAYAAAGWDFVDTWSLVEGLSYPYFKNSSLLRVTTAPSPLINTDSVAVSVETFVPSVFVTIGGGAYPAYAQFDTQGIDTITVSLKQEALNRLIVSAVSETGVETVGARFTVYESAQFPTVPTPVSSLALSPVSATLAPKDTLQFTCVATFADGTTGNVTPAAIWNASSGVITASGLHTHGSDDATVQALLYLDDGWQYSNTASISNSVKNAGLKTDTGLVSGVVRSHYTGLGLRTGKVTGYSIFNPSVEGQHSAQDALGNYSFFMLEGVYNFEGFCSGFRSENVQGGRLLERRVLIDPGPPAEYSEPYYSGQVKNGRPLLYDFSLRPNDTQAPWVVFVEPVADTTVSSERIVVTAIDADQYSELEVAKYAHNAQEHAIPDKISSTGFYRETWPLQQGINVLHLFTMDTEGNASEKTIQITYDPDYTGPGGDSDGDGMPNLWETSHGLDPQSSTGVNGANGDLDGDGLRNLEEYQRGTFPNADRSDSDTLTDRDEILLGTDPLLADTDGDGVNDDVEWEQGSNPLRDDRIKMKVVNLAEGASVRGNAVTVLADVLPGYSLGGVASASFQVRGTGTGNVWRTVGTSTAPPFSATWDTTTLANGTYELRAVATSRAGCVDGTPQAISVTISASAPHFERVVGGVYTLTVPVKSAQNNLIALRDGARVARITIPSGAVAVNDVLTASFPSPSSFTPVLSTFQVDADLYLSLSLATHSGTFLAGKKATIEVGYPDADSDDHLDGSDLRVNYIRVNYLPTPNGSFVSLLSRSLDRLNHFVIATTDHFSTFGVIEEQPAPPLNLLTDALPDGTAGAAYNVLLEANGGAAPRTWAVTSGTLPGGLGLVGASVQGTPTTPGTYTFTLRVTDTQSTPQSVSRSFNVQIFAANQPSVTVTRAPGQIGNTNQLPARWEIVFSEAVNGFNTSDVTLTGSAATGAAFAVTGTASSYMLEVSALTRDGTLHPTIASGKASSIATGALNSASANEEEVWVDRQDPQVWIASTASTPTPTGPIMVQTLPVAFTVTFNEAVYGFDEADISFAGNPPGLALDVLGSGTTFNIVVTGVGAAATLTPSLNADGAADRAGNGIPAATYTGREIQYNPETRRTVTLEQQPAQADPAKVFPIAYDIVFSQPVNGFGSADVAYAGTAPNPQYNVTGSGAAYTLTVTSTSGDGRFAFHVPEDVTLEGNAASTSMDNMVTLDTTPPSLTIGPPSVTTTRQGPVNFIVAYTDASTISLDTSDITLNGTPTAEVTVTPGATVNHRLITLSGISGLGSLGISIGAGTAEDTVGNLAPAAGPSATVTVDPDLTVTVNQATAQRDPTNHAPILFDVQFADPVLGFNSLDVTIGGSAVGVTHNVTGSGANFTIAVTGVAGEGTIVPTIPAGVCLGQWDGINGASTSTDNVITYNPALAMAEFGASPSEGVAPLTVQFTDESILGTLPITTWFWDFGDGNTSTEQNPEHTYEEPGDYTVSLTVTTSSTTNTFTKNEYIQVDSALPGVTSYGLFLTIILIVFIAARMLARDSIKGRGNISK